MTRHPHTSHASAQRGASLLEVLITILILSFGLLGIAGMTAVSLQTAKLAQFQSVGLQLANDYADRMRGNTPGVAANQYDMTAAYTGATASLAVPACAVTTACTAAELASIDRAEWTNSLRRRLPAGNAYVLRSGLAVDIWIMWQEPLMRLGEGNDLSVAGTGGNSCPAAALEDFEGDQPVCTYYRVSI